MTGKKDCFDETRISDTLKTALDELEEILHRTARTAIKLDTLYLDMEVHRQSGAQKKED